MSACVAHNARLVYVDNLYMYAPTDRPISEASPEHARDDKGRLRAILAQRILDHHHRGDLRAVIARPSDFYGPGATNSSLYITGISAGVRGRKMRGLWDIDQQHAFVYLPDLGRMIAAMVERDDGDGQA